uniref:hypothetical protein n=1 Tax=Herbidospora sakaeratensis TaxID=564415 RepID=UPI0007835EEE|nr:hypothetical protein [Herbidospora sakaeratensis]
MIARTWTLEEAAIARANWAAGGCPCCPAPELDNYEGIEPAVIGEGVQICALCTRGRHDDPAIAAVLLAMLVDPRVPKGPPR